MAGRFYTTPRRRRRPEIHIAPLAVVPAAVATRSSSHPAAPAARLLRPPPVRRARRPSAAPIVHPTPTPITCPSRRLHIAVLAPHCMPTYRDEHGAGTNRRREEGTREGPGGCKDRVRARTRTWAGIGRGRDWTWAGTGRGQGQGVSKDWGQNVGNGRARGPNVRRDCACGGRARAGTGRNGD